LRHALPGLDVVGRQQVAGASAAYQVGEGHQANGRLHTCPTRHSSTG
jgi:hypothetical protein